MTLELDEVDFDFVCSILGKALAEFKNRMTDTSISERYRNHFRELAKMADEAFDMMFDAKRESKKEGGDHA